MIRIVKMTFDSTKVDEFLKTFKTVEDKIRNFEGVESLKLLHDKKNPNIYSTYSVWKSEEHLERYRNSAFFKDTWSKVKPLFIEKAEAQSLDL